MTRTVMACAIAAAAFVLATASPVHAQADPHAGHQHPVSEPAANAPEAATPATSSPDVAQSGELPPFIPRPTDEDRKAAFPDVGGHSMRGNHPNWFVLFDQLEWQTADSGSGASVDSRGWFGRDRDRLWFRAEGDSERGRFSQAQTHLLYGRQVSRWWDLVAGVRQDLAPGDAQTWAAVGVQGLAPYWFDIEATAYVGAQGRTHVRLEVEYELLVSNRLIVQPLVEAELCGKADPSRGVGSGLSTTDAGFRIRYELRREIAPYVGVTWNRSWGGTAEFRSAGGETTGGARFVTGLRTWF